MEGMVVKIPEVVSVEIAWKFVFPLTAASAREDMMSMMDLALQEALNPWWHFLVDVPSPMEEQRMRWVKLPRISPTPLLCEVDPSEDLLEKCILVDRQIASFIIGNKPIIKLFQVLKPTEEFNLHVMV